jgi:peptidyl-prolyl cis-trans isomerase A (cyclophilin A)
VADSESHSPVFVEVSGDDFRFTIGVLEQRAPISSRYFLHDVDTGLLDGSSLFRIVNLEIEVIQMGLCETNSCIAPTIEHEPTGRTGLRHVQGTVSLARFAPGAVYHSFFVCMRDEPSLDQDGARNPDGMGFAAFGFVASGFEDLQRLFAAHRERRLPEYLESPIRLDRFQRAPHTTGLHRPR